MLPGVDAAYFEEPSTSDARDSDSSASVAKTLMHDGRKSNPVASSSDSEFPDVEHAPADPAVVFELHEK
jgi:hypothetical protein